MERDRKLQRVLSPSQFRLYVRFVRERPQRIHDYQGWYNNPHYPEYRPSNVCWRYEDHYWHNQWEYTNGRWNGHFDDGKWYPGKYDRPGHPEHRPDRPNHNNGQWRPDKNNRPGHNQHYDRPSRPKNDRYNKDKNSDNRKDRDKDRKDKDRKEKDKKDNKRQESKRSEVYRRS